MSSQSFDTAASPEQVPSTASSTRFPFTIPETDTILDSMIEQIMRLSNELEALGLDTTGLDLDQINDDSEYTCEVVHATGRTLEWVCSSFHIPFYGNKMSPPRHNARKNQYRKDKQDGAQSKNDEKAANGLKKQGLRKTKSATKSLHKTSRKEKQDLHQTHASVLQDVESFKSTLDNGCQRSNPKQKAKILRLVRDEKRLICFPMPDEAFPAAQQEESSQSEQRVVLQPLLQPQPRQENLSQQEAVHEPNSVAAKEVPSIGAMFRRLFDIPIRLENIGFEGRSHVEKLSHLSSKIKNVQHINDDPDHITLCESRAEQCRNRMRTLKKEKHALEAEEEKLKPELAKHVNPAVFVPDEQYRRLSRNFRVLSGTFNGLFPGPVSSPGAATKSQTCATTCAQSAPAPKKALLRPRLAFLCRSRDPSNRSGAVGPYFPTHAAYYTTAQKDKWER